MAHTAELSPSAWTGYFTALACERAGAPTTVQVVAADGGRALFPLLGWSLRACHYDPDRDVLELAVGRAQADRSALRYFVSQPRRILTRDSQAEREILIVDADAVRTLVRLRASRASMSQVRCLPGLLRRRSDADVARAGLRRHQARRHVADCGHLDGSP